MNDEIEKLAPDSAQQAVELAHLPPVLLAASALSREVLEQHLARPLAEQLLRDEAGCQGYFRAQVTCGAPASWTLLWKHAGSAAADKLASGPGIGLSDVQASLFEAAREFLESGLSALPETVRDRLAELTIAQRVRYRVDVDYGGGIAWAIRLYAVVGGAGIFHLCVLHEAPPERLH